MLHGTISVGSRVVLTVVIKKRLILESSHLVSREKVHAIQSVSFPSHKHIFNTYLQSMKIYVGNLSRQAAEQEVRALFEAFGEVKSVKIIKDHDTNESRGFAFVEMSTRTEALRAIKQLEGSEVNGRNITINQSEPRQEKQGLSFFARLLKFPNV